MFCPCGRSAGRNRIALIPGCGLSTLALPAWSQDLRVASIFDEESVKTTGPVGLRPRQAHRAGQGTSDPSGGWHIPNTTADGATGRPWPVPPTTDRLRRLLPWAQPRYSMQRRRHRIGSGDWFFSFLPWRGSQAPTSSASGTSTRLISSTTSAPPRGVDSRWRRRRYRFSPSIRRRSSLRTLTMLWCFSAARSGAIRPA